MSEAVVYPEQAHRETSAPRVSNGFFLGLPMRPDEIDLKSTEITAESRFPGC